MASVSPPRDQCRRFCITRSDLNKSDLNHHNKGESRHHQSDKIAVPTSIMTDLHVYQPTDIVLAKVKGYSAWPSMIIPTEIIPDGVLKTHNGAATSDSESEAEFADSSMYIKYSNILSFRKNSGPRDSYCVKFFSDDSYIWVKYHDLSVLTREECQEWLQSTGRKNKKLIPAYEMALRGLVSRAGIDVWEFVEYGSQGKAKDDEEYVEDDEDEEGRGSRRSRRGTRATRSSSRQRSKRQKVSEAEASTESATAARRTRSRHQPVEDETQKTKSRETRSRETKKPTRKEATTKTKSRRKAPEPEPEPEPEIEVFDYSDDEEDWGVVGLGPQDMSIDNHISPLVKKLAQKKNSDKHDDLKLDLQDRIKSINALMTGVFVSLVDEKESSKKKNDIEIILDELDIAISSKGPHREFITTFVSNNELLFNFRMLFNLKGDELRSWSLWDGFQHVFKQIYGSAFIPDDQQWTTEPKIEIPEESTAEVDEVKAEAN